MFLKKIKNIKSYFRPSYLFLISIFNRIWDHRLSTLIQVMELGVPIFKIHDFGKITRLRASSFEIKEPETLAWIREFDIGDTFMDVGANIGMYSLYAANRDIKVVAIEPDALNYALLNLNIRKNDLGKKIIPYSIAMHDTEKYSKFNISSFEWGGALNSFDNELDFQSKKFKPEHVQGVFGTSLDLFIREISFNPNHLKIDVDGNEYLILEGAKNLLNSNYLKSILVELDEIREDYSQSISLIEKAGFNLIEKTNSEIFNRGKFSKTFNHIFKRK
tara:strand:- start:22867 stop:23691 length:825 start_codon:yes stop_codon:yes gene_type:complete